MLSKIYISDSRLQLGGSRRVGNRLEQTTMTLMEAFGAAFLAFGPALAIFSLVIARDPLRIIILFVSGVVWLISLFASSLVWLAVIPLRHWLYFGVTVSVLMQEVARCCMFTVLRKAEPGLQQFASETSIYHAKSFPKRRGAMYFDAGLGFGIMSGVFALVNVLNAAAGPGTVGIYAEHKETTYFFLTSAVMTGCILLLHALWGVISHAALQQRALIPPIFVVINHLIVSGCSFFIQTHYSSVAVVVALVSLLGCALFAYIIIGGSFSSVRKCLFGSPLLASSSSASLRNQ